MSKRQKIHELNQKLSSLKETKGKLDLEADSWAKKRDDLNKQFADLRTKIARTKDERDWANEEVKALKIKRSTLKADVQEKIEKIRKLREEAKALEKKKPERSSLSLQKEFEDIEWRIQTENASIEEEKQLVGQARALETQLVVYKKLTRIEQEILRLQDELNTLRNQANACHKEMIETAQKSQNTHLRVLETIQQARIIKGEADRLHQLFIEAKQRAKPVHDEIFTVVDQIRSLKGEISLEEENQKKQSEETLKERLGTQAREKLKRGEKLSWQEFQLLAEKEKESQD